MEVTEDLHSELSSNEQPTTSDNSNSHLQRNNSKEHAKNIPLGEVSGLNNFADAYMFHLIRRAEYDSDSEEELPNSGNAALSLNPCSSTSKKSRSLSPLVIIRSHNSTRSTREASFDKLLQSKSNEIILNENAENNSKNKTSLKIHSKTHSGRNKDTLSSTLSEAKSKNELTDSSKVKKGFDGSEKITGPQDECNIIITPNNNRVSAPHLSLRVEHEYPRRVYRSTPHPQKTKHVESIANNLWNSKRGCLTVASLPDLLSDQTSPSVTTTTLTKSQDIISKTKSSCIAAKCLFKRKESNESVVDKQHGRSNDKSDDKSNKQCNSSDTNSEDSFCLLLTKIGIENECIATSNVEKNSLPVNSNISEDKLAKNIHNRKIRYSAFSDEEFVFSDSEEEREYDKSTVFRKLAVKVNDFKKYSSPTKNNTDKKTQRHCKRKSENNNNVVQNKRPKNGHVNCLNPNFIYRLYSFLDEVSKSQQFKDAGERLKEELENNLPCLGLQILTHDSDTKRNYRISSGSSSNVSDAENCVSQIPETNDSCAIEDYQQEQIQTTQEIVKEAFKQPKQPRLKKSVRGRKKARKADKDENSSGKGNKSKDPLTKQKRSLNPKSPIINTDPLAIEESNTVRRSTRFRCPTGYEIKSSEDGQKVLVRKSTYLPVETWLLTKKEAEALCKNRHKNTWRKKSILSSGVIPSSKNSQVVKSQDSSLQQRDKRKLYDANDWLHSSALQSLCVN